MYHALINFIGQHLPEITIFLSLAIGHFIGKLKLGPVQLGGVCGTLLAAIVIGQAGVVIDPGVKNLFFAIFIFALGYAGGPQFFANLNFKGLRMWLLPLIEVISVLGLILLSVKIFGFDAGTATGLMAGSATESAVIGTASEAIAHLNLDAKSISTMQSNVVTAYSITYIFGLITIVIFSSQVAPMLLRVNLREDAARLWESMGGGVSAASGDDEAAPEIVARVYQVSNGNGKTVAALEKNLGGARVEHVARKGGALSLAPDLKLLSGDLIVLEGHRDAMIHAIELVGHEAGALSVADLRLDMRVEHEAFVLSNEEAFNRSFAELRAMGPERRIPGDVFISAITRGGHNLPLVPALKLQKGDIIHLYGSAGGISKLGHLLGKRVSRTERTNFVYLSLGLILGVLVGGLGFTARGVFMTLGTGGGALLAGLVFGWFQNKRPDLPGVPPSAVELSKDLGLSVFVACVGLSAGPQALALVAQYGFILPLLGVSIVLVPSCISLFVGSKILHIETPILLGAIAGQQCSTPAVSAVQAAAGNSTPVLGYTITYAVSNVLLPLLGPLVVGLVSMM